MRFMGCALATTLDLMRLGGEGPEPSGSTEDAVLLQKQGDAHGAAHLQKLAESRKSVIEVSCPDLAGGAADTIAALNVRSGTQVPRHADLFRQNTVRPHAALADK